LSEVESGRASDCKRLELLVKEKEQEIRSLTNQLKSSVNESGSSSKKIAELQNEMEKKIKGYFSG
jgi:septal ring factor EnvC (AmiA/AmiB activator)